MTTPLTGSCLCGACTYQSTGGIRFSLRCHCRDCRQFTGADNLPQVGVPKEGFTSTGPVQTYSRKSASNNDLEFCFCGTCGSSLFKSSTMAADIMFLCAGNLTNPPELAFETEVHTDSRQSWDQP